MNFVCFFKFIISFNTLCSGSSSSSIQSSQCPYCSGHYHEWYWETRRKPLINPDQNESDYFTTFGSNVFCVSVRQ
ncbi:unnamed protein product, partial [Schistosoma haematobium]